MQRKYAALFFFLLLSQSNCFAAKHVIGYQKWTGIFFSFLGVVNHLLWCKKNNATPVVYWGPQSWYYEKNGYAGKTNVWEYYFEPVSNATYQSGDRIFTYNTAPDNTTISPVAVNLCAQYEQNEIRQAAYAVIKEHIKPRPYLLAKIEQFYKNKMAGKKTIAIHLRGTDKKKEVAPINIERLLADANKLAEKFAGCQFLVATDEERLLQLAKAKLKGKVIAYDAQRSTTGAAIHHDKEIKHKGVLGEEVITEVYLLSRCDYFLHTCSSVSTAVLFINPNLEHKMYKADDFQ